jgi:chemotaxis response regulator CheB
MCMTKVLIVDCEFLFDEIVENLLGALDHLAVTRLKPSNGMNLDQAIAFLKPDVLIFDETSCEIDPAHIFDILQKEQVRDRVILINANGDGVQVYERQQIKLEEVDDFLSLFQPGAVQR